jgi:hypothetical protein
MYSRGIKAHQAILQNPIHRQSGLQEKVQEKLFDAQRRNKSRFPINYQPSLESIDITIRARSKTPDINSSNGCWYSTDETQIVQLDHFASSIDARATGPNAQGQVWFMGHSPLRVCRILPAQAEEFGASLS